MSTFEGTYVVGGAVWGMYAGVYVTGGACGGGGGRTVTPVSPSVPKRPKR